MTTGTKERAPLTVEVADGKLVISIGVATLASAITNASDPRLSEEGPGGRKNLTVTDIIGFAHEVRGSLEEEEDGTTAIHLLLENAAVDALEQGCIHFEVDANEELVWRDNELAGSAVLS